MSGPLRRLPSHPSLEQLRKQAKDLLRTLRSTDDTTTLSAAQLQLAREYGFDSWPKLVHHVESLPPAGLEHFTAIAATVADAYTRADFTFTKERLLEKK